MKSLVFCGVRNYRIANTKVAILAQSVERIHGKDEVPGSIPGDGSNNLSVYNPQ